MQKNEIRYYKFWHRLLIGSRFIYVVLFYIFLRIISLNHSEIPFFSFTLLDYITLPIILLFLVSSYRRTVHYLSKIEIGSEVLSIAIHRYDVPSEIISVDYNDLDIEIYLNLFSRYNNYRLEFRKRSKTEKYTFDLIHKQYEIGHWKIGELKKLYSQIREMQGKLSNTDHIN